MLGTDNLKAGTHLEGKKNTSINSRVIITSLININTFNEKIQFQIWVNIYFVNIKKILNSAADFKLFSTI